MSAPKMLTRLTKGQQLTIPARFRKQLGIDESSVLELEIDSRKKRLTIEPMRVQSLKELFAQCDRIRNKTSKSIEQIRKEYERENLLH